MLGSEVQKVLYILEKVNKKVTTLTKHEFALVKTNYRKAVELLGQVQNSIDLKFSNPDIKSLHECEEVAIK